MDKDSIFPVLKVVGSNSKTVMPPVPAEPSLETIDALIDDIAPT